MHKINFHEKSINEDVETIFNILHYNIFKDNFNIFVLLFIYSKSVFDFNNIFINI